MRNQTIKPDQVIFWRNDAFPDELFFDVDWVKSSRNMGVWPRFSLCRDLNTDYYLVLDDDTIPGSRYIEACLSAVEANPNSLLCPNGFIFDGITRFTDQNFHNRKQVGWINQQRDMIRVDWPGHSWFFGKKVLQSSLSLERSPEKSSGEDAHMAYAAQVVGGKCFCMPYPEDMAYWGSLEGKTGDDRHATHRKPGQRQSMIRSLNFYRDLGWVFTND